MTTSSPAAFARAAAGPSITPSCSHTAFAPTAIASSTTGPTRLAVDEAVDDVDRPRDGGQRRVAGLAVHRLRLGCTGTIVMPSPCR